VWIGLFGPRTIPGFSAPKSYWYVAEAIKAKSKLFHAAVTFAEIAHHVERTEYEIYNSINTPSLTKKQFRYQAAEHAKVSQLVGQLWSKVEKHSVCAPVTVDAQANTRAAIRCSGESLDAYDAYIIECMMANGIQAIISEDSDFASVVGIVLVTSNTEVIKVATQLGKLVKRGSTSRFL